jgi:hypothetical protein
MNSNLFNSLSGDALLGCAQYAAGIKKVSFPALSKETFETSCVQMIRPDHFSEAIKSASPPLEKRDRIKVRVKHTPTSSYQNVDSAFHGNCFLLLAIITPR